MVLAVASPAMAEPPHLPAVAAALTQATAPHLLDAPPVADITAGPMDIVLRRTTLEDIRKQLGGTIRPDGDRAWLCYDVAIVAARPSRLWFVASDGGHTVGLIAAEITPDTESPYDCDPAPPFLTRVEFGAPNLDATLHRLHDRYGWAGADGKGNVTYGYARAAGDGTGPAAQTVAFHLDYGQITGFAMTQAAP